MWPSLKLLSLNQRTWHQSMLKTHLFSPALPVPFSGLCTVLQSDLRGLHLLRWWWQWFFLGRGYRAIDKSLPQLQNGRPQSDGCRLGGYAHFFCTVCGCSSWYFTSTCCGINTSHVWWWHQGAHVMTGYYLKLGSTQQNLPTCFEFKFCSQTLNIIILFSHSALVKQNNWILFQI